LYPKVAHPYKTKNREKDSSFFFADTRSTMSEPAKDTAIEITPNPPVPVASRVQSIVENINRASSRVGGRNKKEEDHDARVLENDEPPSSRNTPKVT
jgi:hypothetical protein